MYKVIVFVKQVPDTKNVTGDAMKPDGTVGLYDTMEDETTPAVVIDGNVATILLAEQMLTVAGEVLAQLSLYSTDSERLSTFTFKVAVEANPYTDEAFESTDYFSVLTADIASILAVVTNMPAPATDLPLMDGTAAIGVKGEFARSDHVHPTDTTRAAATDVTSALCRYLSRKAKRQWTGRLTLLRDPNMVELP